MLRAYDLRVFANHYLRTTGCMYDANEFDPKDRVLGLCSGSYYFVFLRNVAIASSASLLRERLSRMTESQFRTEESNLVQRDASILCEEKA